MTAQVSKGASYRQLFSRLSEAIERGFHLEASWIAYAILEDRAISALKRTGGLPTNRGGRPLQMLGPKLIKLRQRLETDPLLNGAMLQGAMLERVENWKEERNTFMHSMAEESRSWSELSEGAERLSRDGERVARDFSDAVTRLRKRKRLRDAR